MVATIVIHVLIWVTTHLTTPEGWKAELAWLDDIYWRAYPESCQLSTIDQGQGRESLSAKDQRPNYCTIAPCRQPTHSSARRQIYGWPSLQFALYSAHYFSSPWLWLPITLLIMPVLDFYTQFCFLTFFFLQTTSRDCLFSIRVTSQSRSCPPGKCVHYTAVFSEYFLQYFEIAQSKCYPYNYAFFKFVKLHMAIKYHNIRKTIIITKAAADQQYVPLDAGHITAAAPHGVVLYWPIRYQYVAMA